MNFVAPSPLPSLAEVYGAGAYAGYVRAHRLIGATPLALVRFRQPAGEFPDPPTDDFTLAINEQGQGRMRFDIGTGQNCTPFRLGDLVLKPPGVATRFAVDAPHQKSFLSLPAKFVIERLEQVEPAAPARDFGPLHAGSFRSPLVGRLLDLIWAETREGNPYGQLFADGAALSLISLLLRLKSPPARAPDEVRPLSPARLRSVLGWIEANLSESFGLEEMAASVCLSPYHFSRAFKAATGQTPRAFVTGRRIEKAKECLADPELPLAQIAHICGFADQSHFTALFGRHVGVTPGAWRRGLV
jgi:AraC family transcriptional regulator